MPKRPVTNEQWLADFGARIARANAAIRTLDRKKVEIDIAARRLDLAIARTYARNRPRLWEELDKIGMSEHQWCKKQGKGNSLVTQRRRLRLLQPGAFKCYLHHRRKFGDNGMYGLDYATVISRLPLPGEGKIVTSARQPASVLFDDGTFDPEWVNLITADCVPEMRKMPPKWYHVIVTSFPYWPARRCYDPDGKPIGFGFEPTWEEWLHNQVQVVGREEKRVLRDDGVLFVAMDDSIAEPGREFYPMQSLNRDSASSKLAAQSGYRVQDSTYLRRKGNWLLLPFRYTMGMMDDGWFLRDVIIIDKGDEGRKESSPSRTRHLFEYLFMFTKSAAGYYYDQDELRIPLAEISATSLVSSGSYRKPGVVRGDQCNFHTISNPMGRVFGSVWHCPPHYVGDHPAPFSPEMVRRCLLLSCPPGGRVLDPFVGSGTTGVVASELGLQFTGIDQNPVYIEDARRRVLAEHHQNPFRQTGEPT